MPKKNRKLKKSKMTDTSGMAIKPPKVYAVSNLNVEKEVKEKKKVKESDVFELPKKKSSY